MTLGGVLGAYSPPRKRRSRLLDPHKREVYDATEPSNFIPNLLYALYAQDPVTNMPISEGEWVVQLPCRHVCLEESCRLVFKTQRNCPVCCADLSLRLGIEPRSKSSRTCDEPPSKSSRTCDVRCEK
jgi:hypothetical protein